MLTALSLWTSLLRAARHRSASTCKRFVKITGTVSFTGGTTPAATATYALALGDPAQEPVE